MMPFGWIMLSEFIWVMSRQAISAPILSLMICIKRMMLISRFVSNLLRRDIQLPRSHVVVKWRLKLKYHGYYSMIDWPFDSQIGWVIIISQSLLLCSCGNMSSAWRAKLIDTIEDKTCKALLWLWTRNPLPRGTERYWGRPTTQHASWSTSHSNFSV